MIYLGADHNGFVMKEALKAWLVKRGENVVDVDSKKEAGDDYPKLAALVAKKSGAKKGSLGILVCGSGNGMAMAANRFPTVRAALAWNIPSAKKAREDEDANVIVLPAWWMTNVDACAAVRIFLTTKPSKASRHRRRVQQLSHLP